MGEKASHEGKVVEEGGGLVEQAERESGGAMGVSPEKGGSGEPEREALSDKNVHSRVLEQYWGVLGVVWDPLSSLRQSASSV